MIEVVTTSKRKATCVECLAQLIFTPSDIQTHYVYTSFFQMMPRAVRCLVCPRCGTKMTVSPC